MIEQNKNPYVYYWILLITCLVALIIIIGGLTRLTDSGLSITNWDLFVGIFPPITQSEWLNYFSLYKNIPEFKLQNYDMTLEEFKVIFWWEYVHRLLGRIIGLLYILPLIFFTIYKKINTKFLKSFYIIFFLICFQGFIGWYMVKSGLLEGTDVSHYRLSLHLTIAFIIFALLLWNLFQYSKFDVEGLKKRVPYNLPLILLVLVLFQISLGAFVSGLDAGKIYNTWPLMNYNYFPDDVLLSDFFSLKAFEIPSLVQFMHRNMAYLIFLIFIFAAILIFKNNDLKHLRKSTIYVFLSLLLQIFLGIFTLLAEAQILIASLHQIGSIILIIVILNLVFIDYKFSLQL